MDNHKAKRYFIITFSSFPQGCGKKDPQKTQRCVEIVPRGGEIADNGAAMATYPQLNGDINSPESRPAKALETSPHPCGKLKSQGWAKVADRGKTCGKLLIQGG